jgi:hypothetical protein
MMLPILRIIPVGGVFLAIMILVLALGAPDGSRSGKAPASGRPMISARGPLQQLDEHPEWRQFLMQAALRRAEELNHLRELVDEPVSDKSQDESVNVAVLPVERSDAEPEDVTGSVNAAPAAILPMEIGETSSMELPSSTHEEKPTVVKTPERVKSKIDVKKKTARRFRRAKPPAKPPEPANFFEAIFGIPTTRQASATTQPTNQPAIRTDTQTR